jgi:uncharacterized protein (TIGR02996 family)
MDERLAFLAAIKAAPADDVPRLVFADWLDEHDEPERAEFIRVQCELEQNKFAWHLPDAARLLKREAELLKTNRNNWLGPKHHQIPALSRCELPFVRGFIERLYLLSGFDQQILGNAIATWPMLNKLSYQPSNPRDRLWLPAQALEHFHTIEIVDRLSPLEVFHIQNLLPRSRVKVWRIWSGASPALLNILVAETPRIQHEIEVVHWYQPGSTSRPSGWHPDPRHGEPDSGVTRINPLSWGFTLSGDLGGGYFAGHLKSGAPALIAIRPDARRVYLTTYSDQGQFSKTLWEDQPTQPWTLAGIQSRFGFTLGTIRVQEFRSGRLALKAFSNQLLHNLLRYYDQQEPLRWADSPINFQLAMQMNHWRSFTLELDGREHTLLHPVDLLLNGS